MAKTFRYRINNTEMLFDDMIYTDPEIGDDSTGNGTKEKPYKTIQKATNMVIKNNTAIILAEGIYTEVAWDNAYTNNGPRKAVFNTKSYVIYFIGQGLKTIVNTTFSVSDCVGVMCGSNNLYMYNITLQIDCQYTGSAYSNYFISTTYSYGSCNYIYNCVFRYVNRFGNRSIAFNNNGYSYCYNCIFDLGSTSAAYGATYAWYNYYSYYYNCVFKNITTWNSPYGAVGRLSMTNCMLPNTNNLTWSNSSSIIYDPIFDNYMNIINTDLWKNSGYTSIFNSDNSISHMGIYGGPYQWKQYTVTPSQININKYAAKINKNEDYNFTFNINAPYVSSTVTNNQVPNGIYGSDNITYKYPMDKTIWTNISGIEII